MRINILIFLVIVLAGCGGGSSSTPVAAPQKSERVAISVEDIETTYYDGLELFTSVDNAVGNLHFSLVEGEASDVVSINENTGDLQVINPGLVQIKVSDSSSAFESSEHTFQVFIKKGINQDLSADDLTLSAAPNTTGQLVPRNYKGQVTYELESSLDNLISLDASGTISTQGKIGSEIVIVKDSGNRRYLPAELEVRVTVVAVDPQNVSYAELDVEYQEGLTLDPNRLSGDDDAIHRYYLTNWSDVLSIDSESGQMTINKAGAASVTVTSSYPEQYGTIEKTTQFNVNISKNSKNQVRVENQQLEYSENYLISPEAENVKGTITYQILEGDQVLGVTTNNRLQVMGVGQARIEIYDDGGDSYMPSRHEFTYQINTINNDELKDFSARFIFQPELIVTPNNAQFKGDISFQDVDESFIEVIGNKLKILKAGTGIVTVIDSGGEFYNEKSVQFTLTVTKTPYPTVTTSAINIDYTEGNCILATDYIEGLIGDIEVVTNSDNSIALFDTNNQCFKSLQVGRSVVRLKGKETNYYLESPEKILVINIYPSGSSPIRSTQDHEVTYSPDGVINSPGGIIHQEGSTLSYRLLAGEKTDVVAVDPVSGKLTILNAGTTLVEVNDDGGLNNLPSSTTFKVTVTPKKREIQIDYEDVVYHPDAFSVLPQNMENGRAYIFSLEQASNGSIELVNSSTGELRIVKAGLSHVRVAEQSRNYYSAVKRIAVNVEKAAHPGLGQKSLTLGFIPGKVVDINSLLTTAYGKRTYQIASGSRQDLFSIDPVTGSMRLKDYSPSALAHISITETESSNYLALPETSIGIRVILGDVSSADNKLETDNILTIYASKLNGPRYANLKAASTFEIAGVRAISIPTQKEIIQHGEGIKLYLPMSKNGVDGIPEIKPVIVYLQRYDGCPSDVNLENLANVEPIGISSDGKCGDYGRVLRFFTLILLDSSPLTEGEWAADPFIIYRSSQRNFSASDFGGAYVNSNGGVIGGNSDEPTKLLEWNLVQFNAVIP